MEFAMRDFRRETPGCSRNRMSRITALTAATRRLEERNFTSLLATFAAARLVKKVQHHMPIKPTRSAARFSDTDPPASQRPVNEHGLPTIFSCGMKPSSGCPGSLHGDRPSQSNDQPYHQIVPLNVRGQRRLPSGEMFGSAGATAGNCCGTNRAAYPDHAARKVRSTPRRCGNHSIAQVNAIAVLP